MIGASLNIQETYQTFRALQLHFTSSYDYFKYGNQCKKFGSVDNRKDKQFFELISKKYVNREKELINYIVHCCVYHKVKWIGDIYNNKKYEESFKNKCGYLESFSYHLKNETSDFSISDYYYENKNKLLHKFDAGNISLEMLLYLDKMYNFLDDWKKKSDVEYGGDLIISKLYQMKNKYWLFVEDYITT